MLTFNTDNMVAQKFPFPAPIMDYIFKNLTASQLLKLYKTCKFFYAKFRLNIIEDLEIRVINTHERVVGNSLAIWHQNPFFLKLQNLWISKSLTLIAFTGNVDLDFTKFSHLTFSVLELSGNSYSAECYELLVKCPNLRQLIIDGKVYDSKSKKNLTFEEIIELAPHVSTFDLTLYDAGVPPFDMTKLLSLDRQTKLQLLHLYNAYQMPDALVIVEFFKKHAVPGIDYYFDFSIDDAYNAEQFYKTVDEGLQAWKLSLQLPQTISSSFIDFSGKIALITGATDGIGKAATIFFRQLGASVIAIVKSRSKLKSLVAECQNITNDGFLFTASNDTSHEDDISMLLETVNYRFGSKFDILVVNIDTSGFYSVPNVPVEEGYHQKYYILESHHNIVEAATSYLLDNAKGCVISVSNTDGVITKPEDASYVANLERRLKIAELELASFGVRTNFVNPGVSITALPRPDGLSDADYKKYLQNLKKSRDNQAANAIAFLASDAAKSIEGAVLPVNVFNLL